MKTLRSVLPIVALSLLFSASLSAQSAEVVNYDATTISRSETFTTTATQVIRLKLKSGRVIVIAPGSSFKVTSDDGIELLTGLASVDNTAVIDTEQPAIITTAETVYTSSSEISVSAGANGKSVIVSRSGIGRVVVSNTAGTKSTNVTLNSGQGASFTEGEEQDDITAADIANIIQTANQLVQDNDNDGLPAIIEVLGDDQSVS